jgi:hypothetical protein
LGDDEEDDVEEEEEEGAGLTRGAEGGGRLRSLMVCEGGRAARVDAVRLVETAM